MITQRSRAILGRFPVLVRYTPRVLTVFTLALLFAASASGTTVVYKQNAPTPIVGGTYLLTEDTLIESNGLDFQFSEDDNFGARSDMGFGSAALGPTIAGQRAPRNVLVRFNVSSLAGQYSSISSVILRLYTTGFPTTPGTGEMYRLTDANAGWVEGVGTSANGFGAEDPGGATYNFRVQGATSSTGTPWAGSDGADLAGTDYLTPALATTAFAASTPNGTAIDFTISNSATATSLINAWTTSINAGLFLKTSDQANGVAYNFYSSEEIAAPAFEPELIVDFVPIPEPESFLLALGGSMALAAFLYPRRRAG